MTAPRRIALVTGAARGIGAALAEQLARDGMQVILVDVLESVAQTARDLRAQGFDADSARIDLSDLPSIEPFMADLLASHGRLDVLVNNAGISPKHAGLRASLTATSLAEWQSVIDINLTACFLLVKGALPAMQAHGWGRIVNMASQAGRTKSQVAGFHYAASKAGLIGFTRALAADVGPFGITANCIAPGRIDTPMAGEAGSEVNARYVSTIPVGRIGTPGDVGAAVSYLASDAAGFVTGVCLDLNGGHFMA